MNIFVKENLKSIHQNDTVILSNSSGQSKIVKRILDTITLPTGCIAIGNPYNCSIKDFDRHVFSQSIQPGSYTVAIYESHYYKSVNIAFIEIIFNEMLPTHFSPAISIKDLQLNRKGPYGYMIQDNTIGIMDAEVYKIISTASNPMQCFDKSIESASDINIDCENFTITNTSGNLITMSVMCGCHYWYWGKTRNNELCSLIGDFYSFN